MNRNAITTYRLTADQLATVDHPADGELIVCGNPGTGKTFCLTFRAARLSGNGSVLVITFNRVLCEQIRDRLLCDWGIGPAKVEVMTAWQLASRFNIRPSHTDADVAIALVEHLKSLLGPIPGEPEPMAVLYAVIHALEGADSSLRDLLQVDGQAMCEILSGLIGWFNNGSGPISPSLVLTLLSRAVSDGKVPQVDYVLVDEVQDYGFNFVESTKLISKKGLTLFVEPHGQLQGGLPIEESLRYILPEASRVVLQQPLLRSSTVNSLVDGLVPRRVASKANRTATPAETAALVHSFLENLLPTAGATPPSIAMLASSRTQLARISKVIDAWLEEHWDEASNFEVELHTLRRSKGLEWEHVVLLLTEISERPEVYIGLTRATENLSVIMEGPINGDVVDMLDTLPKSVERQ